MSPEGNTGPTAAPVVDAPAAPARDAGPTVAPAREEAPPAAGSAQGAPGAAS